MSHQEAITVVAEVNPQQVGAVEQVLKTVRDDPAANAVIPFGGLPTCHFGRLLLLPAAADLDGRPLAPQLLLLSDCDGAADVHLASLVDAAGDGVDRLFSHCPDYPRVPASRDERLGFLRRKSVRVKANYVHRQGRTVQQIRGESKLRRALESHVRGRRLDGLPAVEVRKHLLALVKSDPDLRWAMDRPAGVGRRFRFENAIHAVAAPLGVAALSPVLGPVAILLILLVRLAELRDPSAHVRPTPEQLRELEEIEDIFAHSGFTAGGFVKRGWVRQTVMASVLPLIGYGTRHLFARDSLAGVKTIHFARWIPLDEGRRVVFASNYDGSLESYNNDFIDLVGWGLNLVFSNGNGYPKTRWLVFGGSSREQEFKDFLRCHQIPTPVWYSAYPELTAVNIERNAKLRAGLLGRMNEKEAREWLRLL